MSSGRLSAALPALYVASGAAALMLEVTWSRLLTLQFGHTTGATSTVLAAFMGGLAAGSAVGGRLAERDSRRASLRRYALLEVVIALSAIALPLVIAAATPVLAWAYADGQAPGRFGLARVLVSLLALAVPTFAMGATYPLATRALSPDRGHGERAAGWLYTANTLGAAAGALLAGFVLLPAVGMRTTLLAAAGLNLLAASTAWWLSARLPGDDGALAPGAAADASLSAPSSSAASPSRMGSAERASAAAARPRAHVRDARASRSGVAAGAPQIAWLGLVAAAASGLVALIDQVAWTRVLALIVGPTTFAFSAMVGVFIAGLAIGAAAGTKIARGRRPAVWLGVVGLAGVLATMAAMRLVGRLLLWVAAGAPIVTAFDLVIWREIAVAAALLGPLSITFGAAFPLALAVAGAGGLTPTRLAWTYAANTTGAIAGALLAGFVLIPAVGLQTTLRAGACVSAIVSLAILVIAAPSLRARAISLAASVIVAGSLFTLGAWDPALLSSGAYRFAPDVPPDDLDAVLTAGDLLFYDEGAAGTVAVKRLAGTTSLLIDGKPDASNAGDMLTQKLLAHLPLLLHPAPKRACVLGLGSGVTAGAALTHPLERLDVVEISPGVVEASRLFRAENRDALSDARTRLLLADGRSHLRLSDARYDVVISEPSNPWMAGVAALFTREFMTGVRDRLEPGGIFCQWTHTYDMSPADLRSIAATFVEVFPHASLWLVGESDALLIGSTAPLAGDAATLASRFGRTGVADDLRAVAVGSAGDLASLRVADTASLRAYAAGATEQSDNRMALEFSAPRSLAARTGRENVEALLALAPRAAATEPRPSPGSLPAPPPPPSTTKTVPPLASPRGSAEQHAAEATASAAAADVSRGRMLLRAEAYELAFDALSRAVAARPTDAEALDAFVRAAGGAGAVKLDAAIVQLRGLVQAQADDASHRPTGAAGVASAPESASGASGARGSQMREAFAPAAQAGDAVATRIALARLLMARGRADDALAALAPAGLEVALAQGARGGAVRDDAPAVRAGVLILRELASILADLGDDEHLEPIVARLVAESPDSPDTRYFAASLAFLRGNLAEALRDAQAVVSARPADAKAHNLIGAALATLGRVDEARAAFARSIAADPRAANTYVNAASLEIEHGRPDDARKLFAIALALEPANDAARQGLAAARAAIAR